MPKEERVKRVIHEEPHVRIGKAGITEGVLGEIKRQLESLKVIKVRVLRSYLRASGRKTKEIAEEVAKLVNAEVADVRGHTFVLKLPRRGGRGGK